MVNKQENEPFEKFLRRFNKKVKDSNLFIELKEKSYFKSKSQKEREKTRRNEKRREKEFNTPQNTTPNYLENPWEIF